MKSLQIPYFIESRRPIGLDGNCAAEQLLTEELNLEVSFLYSGRNEQVSSDKIWVYNSSSIFPIYYLSISINSKLCRR